MYSGCVPQTNPNYPNKVINKFEIFEFSEYLNVDQWHVPSSLNLSPATTPLPKFKDYLPKFLGNRMCILE